MSVFDDQIDDCLRPLSIANNTSDGQKSVLLSDEENEDKKGIDCPTDDSVVDLFSFDESDDDLSDGDRKRRSDPHLMDKRFADISNDSSIMSIQSKYSNKRKDISHSVIILSTDEEDLDPMNDKSSENRESLKYLNQTINKPLKSKSIQTIKSKKPKNQSLRRDINAIIEDCDLTEKTQKARNSEKRREKRLKERRDNCGTNCDNECKSNKIVVNIGHNEDEEDMYLSPRIARKVQSHQIDGIRFLFDNVIESIETFDKSLGFGCILSHSMGLGKTLQIIGFVDVFLKHTSAKSVVIVVPVNVLDNWVEEFDKWLPNKYRNFDLFSVHQMSRLKCNKVLAEWGERGGVLLIGYEKFLNIYKFIEKTLLLEDEEYEDEKELAEELNGCLINPGPDLIVCDEGHRIKNTQTGISLTLKKVRTQRRVILTGYPLQNKLQEYYSMIDFVRPNYLGLLWEFNNHFERPITNGQCKDSTEADKQLMRERSYVLNQILKGFIQRRCEDVLKESLPEKQEFVLLCRLTDKQKELLSEFLNSSINNSSESRISLFKTFVVCSKVCNHPDIIYDILQKGDIDDYDLSFELKQELISYSWATPLLTHYETGVLENSNKMSVLFKIIEECIEMGDRILVFSQWIFTLDLIERLLSNRYLSPNSNQKWRKNQSYYRLDGQTSAKERSDLIQKFNCADSRAQMFLLSTKAGGIGINLIGANRIVIFDSCWNPCHDAQAGCRIYRYGQPKPCFIYRLITDHSLEKRVFNKQLFKQGMALGVVDEQNIDLKLNQNEIKAFLVELRHELERNDSNEAMDSQDINLLSDELIKRISSTLKHTNCLTSVPFRYESLLSDQKDLKLSEGQKYYAMENFKDNERLGANLKPNYKNASTASAVDRSVIKELNDSLSNFKID